MSVTSVSDENFQNEVLQSNVPAVVKFTADW